MARGKKEKVSLEELVEQAVVKEKEQPYEVPSNWVWTRLGEVAKWGSGGTPSRKNIEYYNGSIPWVKTGELNNSYIYQTEEYITEEAIKRSSAKLFPINTVAIAMYGATIGKVGILGTEATTNQACACAIVNATTEYKYLFYYLLSQKQVFIDKGKGGAQPNISQEVIKRHECPLPPLAEQQHIVNKIESLFEKLDAAKELVQNALDSFENRKAAILHKAFTGELTAKWREENGVSLNSWEEKKLGDIATFIGGGTPSKSVGAYWNGRVKWASVKDIKGDFLYNTIDYITEEGLENSASNICEIDELLLVTRISPGKTIIAKDTIAINQDLKIIRSNICSRFLHYYFQTKEQEIISKSSGSTVLGIRLEILKEIMINIPSELEQNEIVNIVEQLLTNEQQAQELCNVIEKIDLMKKAILARAFRGELGTNNPEEESAMELLKEVLKEKL